MTSKPANKKILVADDEPDVLHLVTTNLKNAGYTVVKAEDGLVALTKARETRPDLIVLDLMLPELSGLEVCKVLKKEPGTAHIPIIMLTARGDEVDRVAGLDAGADDYIAKPFSTKELLARVRAVLRRRAPEQVGGTVSIAGLSLDASTYRVTFMDQMLKLGPTEFKLLHYFMNHAERVHSRSQLLDKVWGDHVFIEERTVDVHVKRLREALGATAGQMIETVRGGGYRLTAHVTPVTRPQVNA